MNYVIVLMIVVVLGTLVLIGIEIVSYIVIGMLCLG